MYNSSFKIYKQKEIKQTSKEIFKKKKEQTLFGRTQFIEGYKLRLPLSNRN